jgi:hypothetical protein
MVKNFGAVYERVEKGYGLKNLHTGSQYGVVFGGQNLWVEGEGRVSPPEAKGVLQKFG